MIKLALTEEQLESLKVFNETIEHHAVFEGKGALFAQVFPGAGVLKVVFLPHEQAERIRAIAEGKVQKIDVVV